MVKRISQAKEAKITRILKGENPGFSLWRFQMRKGSRVTSGWLKIHKLGIT